MSKRLFTSDEATGQFRNVSGATYRAAGSRYGFTQLVKQTRFLVHQKRERAVPGSDDNRGQ